MPRLRVPRVRPRRVAERESTRAAEYSRFWTSYTLSIFGSAVGSGALAFLAITALNVSAGQVSLMALLAAVASAVAALALAPRIEVRAKRRVLVLTEWIQFVSIGSVVLAALLGGLTFTHLCMAAAVQSAGAIIYASAAAAFLKSTVEEAELVSANSKLEATTWASVSLGPTLGGLLITALGAVGSLVADAVSFLLGALCLRRVTGRYEALVRVDPDVGVLARATAGLTHILGHRGLRGLYLNAMLFGGALTMTAPLLAVLMLRDLQLEPWQYGLALGAPAVGGLFGSVLSPTLVARVGQGRVLVWAGAARGPWLLLLVFAPPGALGLLVILSAQFGLLFAAGLFNPVFVTYRMTATPDALMTRVTAAWSVSAKIVQPACIAVGGAVASLQGVRAAILLAGIACLLGTGWLPWAERAR